MLELIIYQLNFGHYHIHINWTYFHNHGNMPQILLLSILFIEKHFWVKTLMIVLLQKYWITFIYVLTIYLIFLLCISIMYFYNFNFFFIPLDCILYVLYIVSCLIPRRVSLTLSHICRKWWVRSFQERKEIIFILICYILFTLLLSINSLLGS